MNTAPGTTLKGKTLELAEKDWDTIFRLWSPSCDLSKFIVNQKLFDQNSKDFYNQGSKEEHQNFRNNIYLFLLIVPFYDLEINLNEYRVNKIVLVFQKTISFNNLGNLNRNCLSGTFAKTQNQIAQGV